jgi:hypothetical protein
MTETICKDMERYNIGLRVLQETKCGDFGYISTNGTQIIGMPPDQTIPKQRQYGQAFIISKTWKNYYWGARKISERISVAQFRLDKTGHKKSKLCIINVYGPTSMRQKECPGETKIFYEQIRSTHALY